MAEKIVLGLSGGVDSAVAAARLRAQGFDVHGLFLEVGLGGEAEAQRAADELGIPLYIAHRREAFEREVCAYFADAFRRARTPNPCVVCNPRVKFRALIDYADELGAPYIATGHYARTGRDAQGRALLLRAGAAKDQSYMLCRLPRDWVARCVFPLGESAGKDEVRGDARAIGLSAADKPDSMDVCFIPDGDTQGWLERHGAACPPGNFVDEQGNVLGRHKGIHCYTVGQRKGLGIAAGRPLFVKEILPNGDIRLAESGGEYASRLTVTGVVTPDAQPLAEGAYRVKVRSAAKAVPCEVTRTDAGLSVAFPDPVRAPAPGQSAVFYRGGFVFGGGFIEVVEE